MQGPRVAPENRPSVTIATDLSNPSPTSVAAGIDSSRIPGPPRGPSLRITSTSPDDSPDQYPSNNRKVFTAETEEALVVSVNGTEVTIEEIRQYWAHLRLADGSTAWVLRAQVTPVSGHSDR